MTGVRLISCSLAGAPPPLPEHRHQQPRALSFHTARRNTLFLTILSLPIRLPPATAFTLGLSGPKEWLRDQKKKAARFVLAPIDASRLTLRAVYQSIAASDTESSAEELGQVLSLVKAAARDCVPQARNSFVDFQSRTGVESERREDILERQKGSIYFDRSEQGPGHYDTLHVCTFRLIEKNASSLLDDKDPLKLEAEARLSDLVRSFIFLNDVIESNNLQLASNREKVEDALMDTLSSLDKFEQGIRNCLGV